MRLFPKSSDKSSDNMGSKYKNSKQSKPIVACATLSFIITIMTCILGILVLASIDDKKIQIAQDISEIEDERFEFVWGVATEAYHTAMLQSDNIKTSIIREIETVYTTQEDMDILKQELEHPTMDSRIHNIFFDAIKDKYMYYNVNGNDAMVTVGYDISGRSKRAGYIAATRTTAFQETPIDTDAVYQWDDIIPHLASPQLYGAAIEHMLTSYKEHNTLFRQFMTTPEELCIDTMTKEAVYEKYKEQGSNGVNFLRTLVFMAPAYIYDRNDIFNIPDITATGAANNNHKIIVVQSFKVNDMLQYSHVAQMHKYEMQVENIIRTGTGVISYRQAILYALAALWLICVIVIIIVQNSLAQKVELNYLRSVHDGNYDNGTNNDSSDNPTT